MQPIVYKPEKEIKVTKNEKGVVEYVPLLLQLSFDRNRQKSIVESLKTELSEKRKCLVITRFIDESIKLKETLEKECKLSSTFLRLGVEWKDYEKADVVIVTFTMFQSMKIDKKFETIIVTLPIPGALSDFFFGKRILYINDNQPIVKRLWGKFIDNYFFLWKRLSNINESQKLITSDVKDN